MKRWIVWLVMVAMVFFGTVSAWSAGEDAERAARERGDRDRIRAERVARERGARERAEAERRARDHAAENDGEADDEGDEEEENERALPEAEVLAFVGVNMPHLADRLKKVKKEGGEEYYEHLQEISHHIRNYRRMKEVAPDAAAALLKSHQVEHQSRALAERIMQTQSKKDREAMTAQLRQMLSQVFDLRLKRPALEIRHLENEIAEIKAMIEKRKNNKDKIVDRRLREMVEKEDEEMGWW